MRRIWQAVLLCAYLGLCLVFFYRHLWEDRWLSLAFGVGVFVFGLLTIKMRIDESKLAGKQFYLLLAIVGLMLGTLSLGEFILGGKGFTGFSGFVQLAVGVQSAYLYRRVPEPRITTIDIKNH